MIFFRNNLLQYNPDYQKTIVGLFTSKLADDGYLITGVKENINEYILKHNNLKLIGLNEKIYKKLKKI
jgi:chemotaxis methyl-accepting protein methylase